MKPDVHLCGHVRSSELARLEVPAEGLMGWFDGPISAIAACPSCGDLSWLELLDWNRSRNVRIYAAAGLEPDGYALYQRNTTKGSCDVNRLALETQALRALAGPVERVVAMESSSYAVRANVASPSSLVMPEENWQDRLPAAEDDAWFRLVGLDKGASD